MESKNIAVQRAISWQPVDNGIQCQCVAGGLVATNVTVRVVSPRILRVRVTPGAVAPPKAFSYVVSQSSRVPFGIQEEGDIVRLSSECLIAEIGLDPWCLTFRTSDGHLLTQEVPGDTNFGGDLLAPPPGFRAEGLPHDPARKILAVVETLLLNPEDNFYGGGERFTRLNHVGRTIRIWNRNPYGARTDFAYKNMPILVGTRGYGLFVDVPTSVTFHLGSLSNRSYTIEASGQELDYYFIAGNPKEILTAYTDLTGKPAVPPEWALGLWASSCFIQATESSVKEQTARLRETNIPCDVYHFDTFWQKPLMWCDFEWDTSRFPDPPRLLKELHDQGFHICVWENPYVATQSEMFREGASKGYFVLRPDGTIYEALLWSQKSERGMGLCAIVDLTNPDAVAWFRKKHEVLLAQGVDAFKTDFAEEIPEDARFHNGRTGVEMHNPYVLLYQQQVFEVTKAHKGQAIIWGRSGAPGCQRFPGHWSGDPECTFTDFANTIRGGLSAAMSGLAHWSHDMGGFWGTPIPELFIRWSQCGFFSPLCRYHGATARDPWLFGEKALNIFRKYAKFRSRLIPYLYSYAWEAAQTGIPIMRPMVLEFYDDPAGYAFDLQYCLGRELLVSPVVDPENWVTTYLPRGQWLDWWTGRIHNGPMILRRQVPLEEVPLYLRENSLLPLGPERNYVGEKPLDPLTIEAFVTTEARFALKSHSHEIILSCKRQGEGFVFEASETLCTFILRLHQSGLPSKVFADGEVLLEFESSRLPEAEAGWCMEGGLLVVKARAQQIRVG